MKKILFTLVLALSVCASVDAQTPPVAQPVLPRFNDLHPAFRFTAEEVNAAIKKGEDAAKHGRRPDALTNRYKQTPHWTRGNGGKSHESAVWFYGLDGLNFALSAFESARKYEKNTIPDSLKQNGAFAKEVRFEVLLTSVPRVAHNVFQTNKSADERDVTAVKFVLSDDKGNNYGAEPSSTDGTMASGTMTFSGTTPVTSSGQEFSTGSASATVTGPGGTSYGNAVGSSTSTFYRTQFVPWTRQVPYYQARYFVTFQLFDADGTPRIRPDVKQITLHIITADGELSTDYKLLATKNLR